QVFPSNVTGLQDDLRPATREPTRAVSRIRRSHAKRKVIISWGTAGLVTIVTDCHDDRNSLPYRIDNGPGVSIHHIGGHPHPTKRHIDDIRTLLNRPLHAGKDLRIRTPPIL